MLKIMWKNLIGIGLFLGNDLNGKNLGIIGKKNEDPKDII